MYFKNYMIIFWSMSLSLIMVKTGFNKSDKNLVSVFRDGSACPFKKRSKFHLNNFLCRLFWHLDLIVKRSTLGVIGDLWKSAGFSIELVKSRKTGFECLK